jgi:DNA-binding response OmpR family regulator
VGQNKEQIYLDRELCLDLNQLSVLKGTISISLSVTQFRILRILSEHLNSPVSSEDIVDNVWGTMSVQNSELYKQINRIREKIELNPSKPRYLLTVRGFGYLLHTDERS